MVVAQVGGARGSPAASRAGPTAQPARQGLGMLVTVGLVLLVIAVGTGAAARFAVANKAAVVFVTFWALATLLVLVPGGIALASMSEYSRAAQVGTLAVVASGLVLGASMLSAARRLARGQRIHRFLAWHTFLHHVSALVVLAPASWPLLDADLRLAGTLALFVPVAMRLASAYVLWCGV